MRHAIGRASTALEQKGQKLGGLRYMSLDVKQLYGVAQLQTYSVAAETVEVNAESGGGGLFTKHKTKAHCRRSSPRRSQSAPAYNARFRFSE
jgi:hypothetical protein